MTGFRGFGRSIRRLIIPVLAILAAAAVNSYDLVSVSRPVTVR